MIEEKNHAPRLAFEDAMQRCADEAGAEVSFALDMDGNYLQPEMRRALAGWFGAGTLIADQIRGFSEFANARFHGDTAFQSGFLKFFEHVTGLLDLSNDPPDSSTDGDQPEANALSGAAAFDDAVLDGFNRALKEKMAVGRAKGRAGWWSAPVEDLSAMLRTHVDKGDPVDVAVLAMMHWYKDAGIASVATVPVEIVASGELTKVSSSPVMGGQLDIRTSAGPIGITGFPNELARDCKPLLWEQVEIVIRSPNTAQSTAIAAAEFASATPSSLEWLAAGRAAFQAGVDLDTVLAWAAANEIEYRNEGGAIMVRCASLLARSHRHHLRRSANAVSAGNDKECVALGRGAAAVVSERES
ncbi:hypothetical protein [Burkholderia sp. BCC0322]|uniref:hypothetical protein n=1 Tax=unclassified Burkholderia TaxID=2613784 RepID=UPI00158B9856|nr:hypothetical protein [Burkholderia sp. BCC0322]